MTLFSKKSTKASNDEQLDSRVGGIILRAATIDTQTLASTYPALMNFFDRVGNDYYNGFLQTFPVLKHKLSMQQGANLHALMHESVRDGFRVYLGRRELDGASRFDIASGAVPAKLLEKAYHDYYVAETKNPDDLIPPDAFIALKKVGTMLASDYSKKGLGEGVDTAGEDYFKSIWLQPTFAASTGYVLAAVYEANLSKKHTASN